MVFGIIIATNLIDKNNFIRVKDSVETIYEDRLLAKGLIFDKLKAVHTKELAIAREDSSFFIQENEALNLKFLSLVDRFRATELSSKESKVLEELEENFDRLKKLEKKYRESDYTESTQLLNQLDLVKEDLNILSAIQLEEGERQMKISQKAISDVELFTQIEIYFLIFLAVVIQLIVMYNPKKRR